MKTLCQAFAPLHEVLTLEFLNFGTLVRMEIKQDMPPPGGYAKILYQRSFAKTWVNCKATFLYRDK